ncbi:MAG: ribosome biogenesis GTPase Der [Deltaproteobacteria bacterium]|nr:ribosome biogenesis GTPase Der [Deltaproteobacteria bacterium]
MAEPAGWSLPRVAIVGRANVGKSTLFNRLVRQRRSLVEDRPGVTRDRVAAEGMVEGRHVLFVDTGGLDPEAEEGIPAAIRAQVSQVLDDAALVLFIVDARAGRLPQDDEIAQLLRKAAERVVVVANKADGPQQDAAANEFHALGFADVIPTSAEHRRGLADLEVTIARHLPEAQAAEAAPKGSVRVAIVGRPNVGKSSLLNQLIGEDRAIVADEPGTTRDSTDTWLRVGGRDVALIDTAGLRRAGRRRDRLERGSAYMAVRSIERADVVLLILDVVEGITDQDAKVTRLALDRGRPLVLVCNKWDAVDRGQRKREIERQLDRKLGFVPEAIIRNVSALTGKGTRDLLPTAIGLCDELRRDTRTAEVNRVLRDAITRYVAPVSGHKRARFFYATQVSDRPFTVLVFVNDPRLVAMNYRRYLEGFFRKAFQIRSARAREALDSPGLEGPREATRRRKREPEEEGQGVDDTAPRRDRGPRRGLRRADRGRVRVDHRSRPAGGDRRGGVPGRRGHGWRCLGVEPAPSRRRAERPGGRPDHLQPGHGLVGPVRLRGRAGERRPGRARSR